MKNIYVYCANSAMSMGGWLEHTAQSPDNTSSTAAAVASDKHNAADDDDNNANNDTHERRRGATFWRHGD